MDRGLMEPYKHRFHKQFLRMRSLWLAKFQETNVLFIFDVQIPKFGKNIIEALIKSATCQSMNDISDLVQFLLLSFTQISCNIMTLSFWSVAIKDHTLQNIMQYLF